MKRRAQAIFNDNGTLSIVITTRKGKKLIKKFSAVSSAVNYCNEHCIVASFDNK